MNFPTETSGEEIYCERNEHCPVCGSSQIEATATFDSEGHRGWQEMTCNDCSSTWTENWKYSDRRVLGGGASFGDDANEHCPYCGHSELEGKGFYSEGHSGQEDITCLNCNREWTEYWEYDSTLIVERNAYMPFNVGDEVSLAPDVLEDGNYADVIGDETMIVMSCGIGSSASGGTGGFGYDDAMYPEPLYTLTWLDSGKVDVSLYAYELQLA